jgi:hypothetical protein
MLITEHPRAFSFCDRPPDKSTTLGEFPMYGFERIQGIAAGTIRPSRFVKQSTAADFAFLEADANEAIIGVSHESTQDAPIPGASANAAEDGDALAVYPIGVVCLLELGGTVARGDELKSDADGKGVVRATTGTTVQNIGALALESGVSGELIKVLVFRSSVRPALA